MSERRSGRSGRGAAGQPGSSGSLRAVVIASVATAATVVSAVSAVSAVPVAPVAPVAPVDQWQPADSTYAWKFPRDHWSHPGYKTEWWYLTGHLAPDGDTLPRFGYQVTFFRVGLVPELPVLSSAWATRDLVMGHVALTDLASGQHRFSEVLYRAVPLLGGFGTPPDPLIAWSRGPSGTDASWRLTWNGSAFDVSVADRALGFGLRLTTRPAKPLVFQGPNGYSRKGSGATAASQYYSFTRLATTGQVVLGEDTVPVTGQSWMDKEFGSNQLEEGQTGWDWFSLQLDDGREVMLYGLRGPGAASRGTLVDRNGVPRYLTADDWTLRVTGQWRSPASEGRYPAGWQLSVPAANLDVEIVPLLPDQENVSRLVPGLAYWEGAVQVRDRTGRPVGRGYVELTGYAKDARLPI